MTKLEEDSLFEQTSARISSRRKVVRGGGFGLPSIRPLSGINPSSSSESTSRLLRLVEEAITAAGSGSCSAMLGSSAHPSTTTARRTHVDGHVATRASDVNFEVQCA